VTKTIFDRNGLQVSSVKFSEDIFGNSIRTVEGNDDSEELGLLKLLQEAKY